MAAFVSRYASAFPDVVTASKLDTAAIDRQFDGFSGHMGRQPRTARVFREPGHSGG